MRQFRPWANAKVRRRVAASLRGFMQRQKERENERDNYVPKRKYNQDLTAQRTPETHVETRRVPQ